MENRTKSFLKYLIFPLLLLVVLVIIASSQFKSDFLLHVNFYDVGQGDAIFIQTYLGTRVLIDGGPSDKVLQGIGRDLPFFDRKIDLVILTHPHSDHLSGLVDVLKRYKVKKVLLPEIIFKSAAYDQLLTLIEQKHIEKIYASAGQRLWLDNATVFDVYYPNGKISGSFSDGFSAKSQDLNNNSLVGKLSFGKSKFLFTADVGMSIERQLVALYNLDSDVLKVGHHGSNFSTSTELLDEVTPEFAVIEVGKNSYGHPTENTLNNLNAHQVKVFRTDQDQEIDFTSDGVSIALTQ